MSQPLRRVAEELDRCFTEDDLGQPHLSGHSYRAHPFNRDFFKAIPRIESSVRLAFVDGGNCEIVGAPSFSVQLNRVYFNMFTGRERVQPSRLRQRVQSISTTFATFRDGEVIYDTNIFPGEEEPNGLLPDGGDSLPTMRAPR